MATTINLKQSYKVRQIEETIKERQSLLNSGMEEISEADLIQLLKDLDYKIDKSSILDYYNTMNDQHCLERSLGYIDTKTGQSAFHFEQSFTNEANLKELQKIRRNFFVFKNNRIWSL